MKSVKKESRLRVPTSRFQEAAETIKEKRRAKVSEQPTPPVQDEPEPISNVLQGDDILALAIKREDLKKQHIPHLTDTGDKPVITQKFIIRKLRPTDPRRKVCHLVAHPANPDAATKPLDYSGPGDSFEGSDQILPHHILGNLHDFKRIAVARGNTQLAELIPTSPCLLTLISAREEQRPKAPEEEKRPPWAPPLQHNFLKNWQRNMALRKKQQKALSKHLKKPVGELLMHSGETYRHIQEERQLLDRTLPAQRDRKVRTAVPECPVTRGVLTPRRLVSGLIRPVVAAGGQFEKKDITGAEFLEKSWHCPLRSSDSAFGLAKVPCSVLVCQAFSRHFSSLLPQKQVGIAACLTFETIEGEKTSSKLTVANNGTVAIWYDWRRQHQPDAFEDLKRSKMQRFYFNNREGVILPGETKHFTFFFKSLYAGIFRESWEFGTHPTLLGGAVLQVNLHAVSLAQDIFREERKSLETKLAAYEAVTIVQNVLQELLMGVLTPDRVASPADAYLTEEDLFHLKNPRLHYQHQVVQNLHRLWRQYMVMPTTALEAKLSGIEHPEKTLLGTELSPRPRSVVSEPQVPRQENEALRDFRDALGSQKTGAETKSPQKKDVALEIVAEQSSDVPGINTPWEPDDLPTPEWNLCLDDFRKAVKVLPKETQRENALITLNRAALELCQEQKPLQSDLLHQTCLQLWRDVIDSLVSHSLWLRALLGLPEKETVYLDVPHEQDQKLPPIMEAKMPTGRAGKEERKGAAQEKKQLGIRDKEDKKGAKLPGKEERLNSRKQKAKDDKKVMKPASQEGFFSEDPVPDSVTPSQEPIDPLVMDKYTQRLHIEVHPGGHIPWENTA
uniref:MYCBP associated protein n=1 Tax=Microcebus murinus TaxID=30608 RepID=A0A8C6EFI5_MICMU